jgi:hypothetical protein
MNTSRLRTVDGVAILSVVLLAAQPACHAQYQPSPNAVTQVSTASTTSPTPPAIRPVKPVAAPIPIASSANSVPAAASNKPTIRPTVAPSPAIDAEREPIWNSPNMLRARAWLREYFDRSAKISPAERREYMNRLQNLTPSQMKLWLLKFDREEEVRRQQYALFDQARAAAIARARLMEEAARQSYGVINFSESQAAVNQLQQLNSQAANENIQVDTRELENAGPDLAYGPHGGLY